MKPANKKISGWLAFMLCFAGIPCLLVIYGFHYLAQQKLQTGISRHTEELNRFYRTIEPFTDAEKFWCGYLTSVFNNGTISDHNSLQEINSGITRAKRKLAFNHIVFNQVEGIATSSIKLAPARDWSLSLSLIWKTFTERLARISDDEQRAAGRILGPQLNIGHLNNGSKSNDQFMAWPDSTMQKPLIWANMVKGWVVVIFVALKDLESIDGIKNFLSDFSNDSGNQYGFAIYDNQRQITHSHLSRKYSAQIKEAIQTYREQKLPLVHTKNLIVYPRFIKSDLTVIGFFEKAIVNDRSLQFPAVMAALFLAMGVYLLGRYSYRLIVQEVPDSLSLRWKLRFLFFFANGLPLLVLFFIGTDYLNHKRDNLLRETLEKGTSFLQEFDEKIETEYARTLVAKKKAENILLEKLAGEELGNKNLLEFVSQLDSQTQKVILIASSSNVIGTKYGIIDEKRGIFPEAIEAKGDMQKNQLDYTRKVGQFFLDKINGAKVSEKTETEIELLIESVTQKPLGNFIYDLLQHRGDFIQWGFGQNVHPAIMDTLYRKGSTTADYFFIATFRRIFFQHNFLMKQLPVAGRNNLGMRLIAFVDSDFTIPREAWHDNAIVSFATALTSYPSKEISIIDYEGEKYLAMGFIGNYIKDYRLIGLCPLERIDSIILNQRRQLFTFAILSLLMTFGLSQFLARGFLVPLQLITSGAKAIESKNFHHRLPDLGRDEFGAMGNIFNNVMVDLEELSVASAIQEQLLPQAPIPTGNFSLFGRSISMGELGGDYFDHIELGDNKFSVLLGDVAGHGVGAALIMAMAKAGIIQSEHLLDQPQALLSRLHNLILASKTKKQKKVMTFQYLFLDGLNGIGIYANAGACSPIMIRENATVAEEITLPGAALGAFKKASFSERQISFLPGDAMVFYTDGIVEARNSKGEELGYDNLRILLKKSWNTDAAVFYDNIYRGYLEHIGEEKAQDDLTMVVLVYLGENPEAQGKSEATKDG
jgi:hypothetical protein